MHCGVAVPAAAHYLAVTATWGKRGVMGNACGLGHAMAWSSAVFISGALLALQILRLLSDRGAMRRARCLLGCVSLTLTHRMGATHGRHSWCQHVRAAGQAACLFFGGATG